jgi:DNA-binding CsgD family transcriptional regulator
MGELQRISPALWGLAETAQLQGDFERAIALCEKGFAASNRVGDAAYLYPFLVTGARAQLAQCDPPAAEEWVDRVEQALTRRSIPGTLPAIEHARGLLQLAAGDRCAATATLERARVAWAARHRFWEGSWAALELARGTAPGDCGSTPDLIDEVRTRAEAIGATPLVTAADAVRQRATATEPWHPLTAREFSVANLVSAGMTNREIATELFVSPRTVSAHVEHILTKLGAGRRAEIAAWAARISA